MTKELSFEEKSLYTRKTSRYFGDSTWGKSPTVRCTRCRRHTSMVRLKTTARGDILLCNYCW